MSFKVIDIHAHVLATGWLPEPWWRSYRDFALLSAGPLGPAEKGEQAQARLMDADAGSLIETMDRAGISRSVLLPLDFGLALGEPDVSIEQQNQLIWTLCQSHPERLSAFVGIDPRRPGAIEFAKEALSRRGACGIKLYPACGFSPDDPAVLDFLAATARFRVPVLLHSGHAAPPLRSSFCDPIRLDEALLRFPETPFIAAHLGGGWHEELFWMGRTRANLWVDFSGWQSVLWRNPAAFAARLRGAIDAFGPYRVLFGTDAPFYESKYPAREFVARLSQMVGDADGGAGFGRGEIQAVLGGNASRLLAGTDDH